MSQEVNERKEAMRVLGSDFAGFSDKVQAWEDLIKLISDTDSGVRRFAAYALGRVFVQDNDYFRRRRLSPLERAFVHVPDKKQAWEDLHSLTSDTNYEVRWGAAYVLGRVFSYMPDKKQAWDDLHRLTSDTNYENHEVCLHAANALGSTFSDIPDKKQGWEDLIRLTTEWSIRTRVRWNVADALGKAFAHVPDKKKAWDDLISLSSYEFMRNGIALGSAFVHVPDKRQAWEDLHRLTFDTDSIVREGAASALGSAFTHVPEKKQAWDDLIRLTSDTEYRVHLVAVHALGSVFSHVPDKKQAGKDLHRLTFDTESHVRTGAAYALGKAFAHVPDKKQAGKDLHRLTSDKEGFYVCIGAGYALGSAFAHVPDKKQAWKDLIRLTSDSDMRPRTIRHYVNEFELVSAFAHVPDKKKAWDDLIQLTSDWYVNLDAADALGGVFSHVPDKKRAWDDLHRLTSDTNLWVRWGAASALGRAFGHLPDKKLAWDDLMRLASDNDNEVRAEAVFALGSAFSYVPDKKQAWEDLIMFTSGTYGYDYPPYYYSLGKASIFKAINAENDIDLKKEIEIAIGYFMKSSGMGKYGTKVLSKPAMFCLLFYRSFFALTFNKEKAEAEVQKYRWEAKSAIQEDSWRCDEILLEAVENLGNALKEVQKAQDFDALKCDLDTYGRYCERACKFLERDWDPRCLSLIRKAPPIIDERIKGILEDIQEKAKALCKQVKDTEYKEIVQQVNNVGQELSKVIDPIQLEKEVSHMLIPLSAICKKMPEEDRGEVCEILKQINDEQYVEDKLSLINMFLSKMSTQMNTETKKETAMTTIKKIIQKLYR